MEVVVIDGDLTDNPYPMIYSLIKNYYVKGKLYNDASYLLKDIDRRMEAEQVTSDERLCDDKGGASETPPH